jgi:hypothetical protein
MKICLPRPAQISRIEVRDSAKNGHSWGNTDFPGSGKEWLYKTAEWRGKL